MSEDDGLEIFAIEGFGRWYSGVQYRLSNGWRASSMVRRSFGSREAAEAAARSLRDQFRASAVVAVAKGRHLRQSGVSNGPN